jgi:Protein of unknown function (DUF2971)
MWEAAYGPTPIPGRNLLGAMIALLRYTTTKIPEKADYIEFMRPGVIESLDRVEQGFGSFHAEIHAILATMKILCLSASPIAAPMWGNYAADISGAALGFSPYPNTDSIFLTPRPITYVANVPILLNNERTSDVLSGRASMGDYSIDEIMLYTKSEEWSYEREWRIAAGQGWDASKEFEYVRFDARDLRIIIFGIRATSEFKEEATAVFLEKYPFCLIQSLTTPPLGLRYEIA